MGELLFSEEERVQDRGGGKVNAERWASEFGVKDWAEAVWGALSGSRVKFLDRLLIISYHFGLLNGFKYWYRRMHDSRIVTVTCVGGDAIWWHQCGIICTHRSIRIHNWCERKNNLCAIWIIWMRIWIRGIFIFLYSFHIHIPRCEYE